MNKNIWRYGLGALLVVLGGLSLLESLNVLRFQGSIWELVFGVLFGGVGVVFCYVLFTNKDHWWASFPGFTMLALGAMMVFNVLIPGFEQIAGAFFLAGIGASFWVVYILKPDFWWAIIPGGALVTLSVVALPIYGGEGSIDGGVFFLGLAATFGLVALLPSSGRKMGWALIPAAVLAILGVFIGFSESAYFNYVWPAVLILGGIILLLRAFIPRRQ